MDFTTLPPEVNSGLMYSGPGAGSMREAATAWGQLAARLGAAAADYREVLEAMVTEHGGPTAIIEAAAPYLDWIDGVAARSELAGIQLAAAVNAHQEVLTAMVPPPLIVANRSRRQSLAAGNPLAQASPVIADLDAEYEQMWLRDADAMCAYADASTDAAALTPFASPPGNPGTAAAGWTLESAPDVISTGHQLMSAIPDALLVLSSSRRARLEACLAPVTSSLSRLGSLTAPSDFAINHLSTMNKAAALQALVPDSADANGDRVIAGLGHGFAVGLLSVPHAWIAALPDAVAVDIGWIGAPIRLVTACALPGSHAASQYDG